MAFQTTSVPTLVGEVVELAGSSKGDTVKDGAALPTVTEVVIFSACASKTFTKKRKSIKKEAKIASLMDTLKIFLVRVNLFLVIF